MLGMSGKQNLRKRGDSEYKGFYTCLFVFFCYRLKQGVHFTRAITRLVKWANWNNKSFDSIDDHIFGQLSCTFITITTCCLLYTFPQVPPQRFWQQRLRDHPKKCVCIGWHIDIGIFNSLISVLIRLYQGLILTLGKGLRAGNVGPHGLGPRPGGLEAGGLELTPGRVIPAVLPWEVGDTRAKASSSRECICCRASSIEGCGGM